MQPISYVTKGGVRVDREIVTQPYTPADTALADRLDERRGVLFSSSFEFPGRYTRWDMGFVDPPLVLTARGRGFAVELGSAAGGSHRRGGGALAAPEADISHERWRIEAGRENTTRFRRGAQPPAASRCHSRQLFSVEDEQLGLYNAFGYDLVFDSSPSSCAYRLRLATSSSICPTKS